MSQPICNALRSDGTRCPRASVTGGTRCYRHGGQLQMESVRRQRLSAAAEAEVAAAVVDPATMDPRQPVALSRVILDQTPLTASDEEVYARARVDKLKAIGPSLVKAWKEQIGQARREEGEELVDALYEALEQILEPTEGDLDAALRAIHKESLQLVSLHAQRQTDAVRALEVSKAIHNVVMPFLGELGIAMSNIVRKYVPENHHNSALQAVAVATSNALGLISESGRKVGPVPNPAGNR